MKVDFDENFCLMKVVLMNLCFTGFLGKVKGLPCDPQDGIVRVGQERNQHHRYPFWLERNPDTPDNTEGNHSETAQETADTNDAESNSVPGESLDKKKLRFSTGPGDGGACAITAEEQVEDYWSDEHGQGACLKDATARWNQTRTRQPPRLRWIVCWQTELCETFLEMKELA